MDSDFHRGNHSETAQIAASGFLKQSARNRPNSRQRLLFASFYVPEWPCIWMRDFNNTYQIWCHILSDWSNKPATYQFSKPFSFGSKRPTPAKICATTHGDKSKRGGLCQSHTLHSTVLFDMLSCLLSQANLKWTIVCYVCLTCCENLLEIVFRGANPKTFILTRLKK